MKIKYSILLLLCWLGLGAGMVSAQQLAVSNYFLFKPSFMNPGFVQSIPLGQIYLGHQHRQLAGIGWRSNSQFLTIKGKPFGKKGAMGWGVYISNDIEHTERRTALGVSMGAMPIKTETAWFSVGFSGGLINWGADYSNFKVYDRNDELVFRPTNFAELDAAVGIGFGINTYTVKGEVHGTLQQLPGTLLSKGENRRGLLLYPHVMGGGNLLFSPFPDFWIGPMGFYRNVFTRAENIGYIKKAQWDAGLRMEFERPKMWFGGAWRADNSAVTAGFGIEIAKMDTLGTRAQMAYFTDLNLMASYPMNESSVFGPSVELGLTFSIGRVGDDGPRYDTLGLMKGAFWINNGNMNYHKEKRLETNGPSNLFAETTVADREVALRYEYDDNLYMYTGGNLEVVGDSVYSRLGGTWTGVDAILENMVKEVIQEALDPDKSNVEDPDSLEPLKTLSSIGIGSLLRFDEIAATFGAEGLRYSGGLIRTDPFTDTLSINLIYGESDTNIVIAPGQLITNLELAALKVYTMDKKLQNELYKFYGERYLFVRQGERLPETDKALVTLMKPVIIPNNPNQKPFQVTTIDLNFLRDPNWEPEVVTAREARQKEKELKRGRDKNKRQSKRQRNRFREEIRENNDQ